MMKTLILDYSTWRCGQHGPNQLGYGETRLVNEEGCMCCLGQFTPQLNPKVTAKDMLGCGRPNQLEESIALLTEFEDKCRDTDLALHAIAINDDESTTPLEKIGQLKELFAKSDCEIEVINLPIK